MSCSCPEYRLSPQKTEAETASPPRTILSGLCQQAEKLPPVPSEPCINYGVERYLRKLRVPHMGLRNLMHHRSKRHRFRYLRTRRERVNHWIVNDVWVSHIRTKAVL